MASGITRHSQRVTQSVRNLAVTNDLTVTGDVALTGDLVDSAANIILSPDGSGAIDSLARIDDAVDLESEAQEVTLPIIDIVRDLTAGTPDKVTGGMQYNANTTLYCSLATVFPFKQLGGSVKIEALKVYFTSSNALGYLSMCGIYSHDQIEGGLAARWSSPTDYGNGSTGEDVGDYTPNYTMVADLAYMLEIDLVIAAGTIDVHCVEIKYTIV